jgi:CHAT domain-containing protein
LAVAQSRGGARETAAGRIWEALPGADAEIEAIGNLYRQLAGPADGALTELRGAAATEENLRSLAPQSRILHLATHGFFATGDKRARLAVESQDDLGPGLGDDPLPRPKQYSPGLLSGVVLACANFPPELPSDLAGFEKLPEDGILTAEELAFLPLGGVELVVLSACETGLGEAAGGEGLLGIQRAFQMAGARTTVATLWKVDDAMTQRLMTAFYRNALEGKQGYLDALRNAQLGILRELRANPGAVDALRGVDATADGADDEAVAHGAPFYWAAFTLSGDWR